jgi:Flp pilus assembly pilin Flp
MKNDNIVQNSPWVRLFKQKRGQTLVEYSIILALISVVAIGVLIAMGGQVKGSFTTITSQLSMAGTPAAPSGGASHGG